MSTGFWSDVKWLCQSTFSYVENSDEEKGNRRNGRQFGSRLIQCELNTSKILSHVCRLLSAVGKTIILKYVGGRLMRDFQVLPHIKRTSCFTQPILLLFWDGYVQMPAGRLRFWIGNIFYRRCKDVDVVWHQRLIWLWYDLSALTCLPKYTPADTFCILALSTPGLSNDQAARTCTYYSGTLPTFANALEADIFRFFSPTISWKQSTCNIYTSIHK